MMRLTEILVPFHKRPRHPPHPISNHMIQKMITFLFLLLMIGQFAFGQVRDSISFSFSKEKSLEKGNDLYEITIENLKDTPIAILFVPSIKLFYDPPQRLATYTMTDSCQLVSLHYSARELDFDWENKNPNYDAETILPYQHITFRVYIPRGGWCTQMIFDYIILRNFCYNDFKQAIFRDAAAWYKDYTIKHATLNLSR
jgi:hypothetical protein